MKGRIFLIMVLLFIAAITSGCGGSNGPTTLPTSNDVRTLQWYDAPTVFPLLTGKNINVGSVTVKNDLSFLHVTFDITGGWSMKESHVAVATSLNGIPHSWNGTPNVWMFPYGKKHNPSVTTYTYDIPLNNWTEGTQLFFATECVVQKQQKCGGWYQCDTAWAGDHKFKCGFCCNIARYFHYCVQGCHIDLPKDPVCVTMHYPGTYSYWSHDLTSVPEGFDVTNGNYLAWCLQPTVYAYPEQLYCDMTLFAVTDPSLPAIFTGMQFDKINWVLNHKGGASIIDIQTAIWYFTGATAYPTEPGAIALVEDADANGVGYVPGAGEIMAVIIYISDTVQSTFIEVEVGC
jgi:hypothetical protein